MNYMSKNCKYSNTNNNSKKDEAFCPTIIRCNSSTATTTIPAGSTASSDLITVNLNTCNIDNPCNKVDFSANITFPAALTGGSLSFQLFRSTFCNINNATAIGPAWIYSVPAGTTNFVSFSLCDCGIVNTNCNCNCNYDNDNFVYFVRVTPTDVVGASILITNPTIAATSTCNTNPCCC